MCLFEHEPCQRFIEVKYPRCARCTCVPQRVSNGLAGSSMHSRIVLIEREAAPSPLGKEFSHALIQLRRLLISLRHGRVDLRNSAGWSTCPASICWLAPSAGAKPRTAIRRPVPGLKPMTTRGKRASCMRMNPGAKKAAVGTGCGWEGRARLACSWWRSPAVCNRPRWHGKEMSRASWCRAAMAPMLERKLNTGHTPRAVRAISVAS